MPGVRADGLHLVPYLSFGPAAGLATGYARLVAGAPLVRGHASGWPPDYFSPLEGKPGRGRFDCLGIRPLRSAGSTGTCYLAAGLVGVLLEVVLRGDDTITLLNRSMLSATWDLSDAAVTRDLVMLDLWMGAAAHHVQVDDVALRPLHPPNSPYPVTQRLADGWRQQSVRGAHPVPGGHVDGILYGSRFGPASLCVALDESAEQAIAWGGTVSLGTASGLADAGAIAGVDVVP